MKFRYYITVLYDGAIKGTDNTQTALDVAESEDCFVVDTQTGEWLQGGRISVPIEDIDG